MAVFPCDHTPHRYPGPQRSMYITRIAGQAIQTRKLRLCERHFEELAQFAARDLQFVMLDSTMSSLCLDCGQPYDESISVKMFAGDQDPAVWAGEFCAEHAEVVGNHLLWSKGRGL